MQCSSAGCCRVACITQAQVNAPQQQPQTRPCYTTCRSSKHHVPPSQPPQGLRHTCNRSARVCWPLLPIINPHSQESKICQVGEGAILDVRQLVVEDMPASPKPNSMLENSNHKPGHATPPLPLFSAPCTSLIPPLVHCDFTCASDPPTLCHCELVTPHTQVHRTSFSWESPAIGHHG